MLIRCFPHFTMDNTKLWPNCFFIVPWLCLFSHFVVLVGIRQVLIIMCLKEPSEWIRSSFQATQQKCLEVTIFYGFLGYLDLFEKNNFQNHKFYERKAIWEDLYLIVFYYHSKNKTFYFLLSIKFNIFNWLKFKTNWILDIKSNEQKFNIFNYL